MQDNKEDKPKEFPTSRLVADYDIESPQESNNRYNEGKSIFLSRVGRDLRALAERFLNNKCKNNIQH
jgi:hypothetical protein